jgi:hypothetical protein
MATTEVHITRVDDCILVPDVSTVNIVAGDSIEFWAETDGGVLLCMTPATASFLTPSPDGSVAIDGGGSATFQFSAAPAGVYSILLQWPGLACPVVVDQPGGTTATVSIQTAAVEVGSGPDPGIPQT